MPSCRVRHGIRRITTMISISHLPLDLESDILSRVPSMSLAKLRTTCKRWYALFKDPKFVKKNNLANAAKEEVMFLMKFGVYSISLNLHGIHSGVAPCMEFTRALSRLKDLMDFKISQIFHCDGLILCSSNATTQSGRRVVVWNPCTGQTRSIEPRRCYQKNDKYAFGYGNKESSCRSYKLLRICPELRFAFVEIYEFSSDSWRALDRIADKRVAYCSSGVSLKGNTYWIADYNYAVLLSFDFTVERFVFFPLPYDQSHHPSDTVVLSVVREEKLALLRQNIYTMTVWLSNKIDDAKEVSWSKFLVVDPIKFEFSSFLVDEEKKVVVCSSGAEQVYMVGEDLHKEITKVSRTVGPWSCCPRLLSYVPSLVDIPKLKEKNIWFTSQRTNAKEEE